MNKFKPKILTTQSEHEMTANLVHRVYKSQGYVNPDDKDIFLSIIQPLKKETNVVFGIFDENVVLLGTISIFIGEDLPMEEVFHEEINSFRKKGMVVAEIGRFAIDREYLKEQGMQLGDTLTISRELMKAVFNEAMRMNVDILCIAVAAQKHDQFYNAIGFKSVGTLKKFPFVNDTLAVAKVFDICDVLKEVKENKNARSSFLREIISNLNE